ncbi:unnamed protein product [Ectocarpus sp. CCAP 1310/34]|nr:unnamed protein product [Ectocarpus sp. CCAP 1310/34]
MQLSSLNAAMCPAVANVTLPVRSQYAAILTQSVWHYPTSLNSCSVCSYPHSARLCVWQSQKPIYL